MYTVQNPIDEDVVHNSRMTVEDVDSAVQLRKESGCYQSEILAGSDITVNERHDLEHVQIVVFLPCSWHRACQWHCLRYRHPGLFARAA